MNVEAERGKYGETKISFRYKRRKCVVIVPARESVIEYLQDKYNYIGSELWLPIKRHVIPYFTMKKARQLYVL